MIRIIDFRLIIEKHDTHEKYYPKVVSFNTVNSLPLTNAPSSTIRIISSSNLNDVATVSQVEYDDILRLQASIKFNVLDQDVWVDIFEGRIQNQSKEFGENNEIEFPCAGHITQAFDRMISVNTTFENIEAALVIQTLSELYLTRLTYSSNYADTGLTISEYNMVKEQNFVIDAFQEMEKLGGYKWMIDVVPKYTSSGNLQTCYLRWRKFPTVPTTQYAVIEGTPRLISASFDVVGEDVKNFRYVKGGTDASGNQYSGSAFNSDSISTYEARYAVDTFSWIESNTLCREIAAGLVSDSKNPYVAGQVVLEGTIDAHLGDLVPVKIPSLEVKGVAISGNYTVYRVAHNFSGSEFKTTLDLGRIKKNEYDYISKNITQVVKTSYKNQAK